MVKIFKLSWTPVESKANAPSEWNLLPMTPSAFSFAEQAFLDSQIGWIDGIHACANRRDIFVFRDRNANLEAVIKNLLRAGFSADEIEVVNDKPFTTVM